MIYSQANNLNIFFRPKTIALIGATDRLDSVGRTLLENLLNSSFSGVIYPVNPKGEDLLGIKTYTHIKKINKPVELAIIATPADTIAEIIEDCVSVGIKGAVIISAGFRETGVEGIALEKKILEIAQKGNMRIIGPNCLGVMSPVTGLNATFTSQMAKLGKVAFLSQSGALCTAILDWSLEENLGFSAFVSLGSMLDIGWGEMISYLGNDPNTESIVIYMESIINTSSFLLAARGVALTKPIIVLKAGRNQESAKAAQSHTGSLSGDDEVLDAAFARCGVLRVDSIEDLFNISELLAKEPHLKGKRLTVITNAGGPGVLATDVLINGGGELAKLDPATLAQLDTILPKHWSHANPIDILGDATPDRYQKALTIASSDPNTDAILVILTPQAMSEPTTCAQVLIQTKNQLKIPILACWMGGQAVAEARAILNAENIFTTPYPDLGAHLFNLIWRYKSNLKLLYQNPLIDEPLKIDQSIDQALVEHIIQSALAQDRALLTELESKKILQAYGLPALPPEIATSAAQAVELAQSMGYPIVLKLHSLSITHKSDVQGVKLNLHNEVEVLEAYAAIQSGIKAQDFQGITVQPMLKEVGYELILGSSRDSQFGAYILFGAGGVLVEILKDKSLDLPPLNRALARAMIEKTKIYQALKGYRGKEAIDLEELEFIMVRFSQLVVKQKWIKEIDINPMVASSAGIFILDARIILAKEE